MSADEWTLWLAFHRRRAQEEELARKKAEAGQSG